MKTKILRRISLVVVAIMLVTMCLFSVTFARYTSTFTGSFSSTTKSWEILINGSEEKSFTITPDTAGIYPGMRTQAYFFNIVNNGDLSASYKVTLRDVNKPDNVSIYLSEGMAGVDNGLEEVDGIVLNGTRERFNVEIAWPYGENVDDTAFANTNISFTVSIVVDQLETAEQVPQFPLE